MREGNDTLIFEQASPTLLGLAYRLLGSWADAEDAVQDTYLKWRRANKARIENPAGWLTTICTRRCIDLLRSAHRSRVTYVGTWLPEPIYTSAVENAADLETAFLLLLERLTPKERAAFLLYEVFEMPYAEIARTLGLQEATCRKLVSRARAHVDRPGVRHETPSARQDELLAAFEAAIAGQGTDRLAALLTDDIELATDGGGKVTAVTYPLHGREAVLRFVERGLRRFWEDFEWVVADLNGQRGLLLRAGGVTDSAVSFAYDEAGALTGIYIVRNPDKLTRLSGTIEHGRPPSPAIERPDGLPAGSR